MTVMSHTAGHVRHGTTLNRGHVRHGTTLKTLLLLPVILILTLTLTLTPKGLPCEPHDAHVAAWRRTW